MSQNYLSSPRKSTNYFFLKSKDIHIENGKTFITLFARLTREISLSVEGERQTHVETVWVEIEELPIGHAPKKVRTLPNCMQRYAITENVFRNLHQLSKKSPKELFYVTPYHQGTCRKNFLSYQQLNLVSPF